MVKRKLVYCPRSHLSCRSNRKQKHLHQAKSARPTSQTTQHQPRRPPKRRPLMSQKKLKRTRRMTLQKLLKMRRTKTKAKTTSPLSRPKSSQAQKVRLMLPRRRPKITREKPRRLSRAVGKVWVEKIERQKPFALARGLCSRPFNVSARSMNPAADRDRS